MHVLKLQQNSLTNVVIAIRMEMRQSGPRTGLPSALLAVKTSVIRILTVAPIMRAHLFVLLDQMQEAAPAPRGLSGTFVMNAVS